MQAAANYINNGYYQEALNVLSGISSRNARWYYLSALANSGVGNNVKAQEDISEAVRLEPNNFQYQSLKQRLEGGTGWYQKQSTVYGRPDFSGPGLVHEDVSAQSALQLLLQQRYVLRYTDRISMIRKRGILSD